MNINDQGIPGMCYDDLLFPNIVKMCMGAILRMCNGRLAASKRKYKIPKLTLHLLELPKESDLDELRSYVDRTQSACVFVADTGKENILA